MELKITGITAAPAGWEVETTIEFFDSHDQNVAVVENRYPVVAWALIEIPDRNENVEYTTEPMIHEPEWGVVTLSVLKELERASNILTWRDRVLFNGSPRTSKESARPLSDHDVETLCRSVVRILRSGKNSTPITDEEFAEKTGVPVERIAVCRKAGKK